MTDLLEMADHLEDLAAACEHANNRREAKALRMAAKVFRARNDTEPTEPSLFVCPNCEHMFPPPSDE